MVETAPAGKMEQAIAWLAEFLADEKPHLASEVMQRGKDAGHSEVALRFAKNRLKLRAYDARMGLTRSAACVQVWQMPDGAVEAMERRQRTDAERHTQAVAHATERMTHGNHDR